MSKMFAMKNPVISNDGEVFTERRDFINHVLMVQGHQRGAWLKVTKDINEVESWLLMYTSHWGEEQIFMSSYVSEADLWARSEREAQEVLVNLNSNRVYDDRFTLADAIKSAKEEGWDATHYEKLLEKLKEATK